MDTDAKQPGTGENKAEILIVDDHAIVRQGLAQLISQEPDLVVCGQAENAEQALQAVENLHVDLAVVDISLSGTNGVELTGKIKAKYPHLPVLILTMHDEAKYAERAFKAGAKGYVTKHEAAETIITAIRLILCGHKYISQRIDRELPKDCARHGSYTDSP
ncbi:MAG: response regulator [Planctomycetota bacterium]|jgi:DNA-binding NarL/FixJ family response regulator